MKESTLDRQRRVLVIGNNTVDLVFRMPGTISPDRKSQAESLAVYAGGQAANVAHGLAILGIPVEYVGAFGDDEDSALSRRSLEDVGMSLTGSISVPGCPAHRAAILVDSLTGSRSIVMYKDKRLHLTAEYVSENDHFRLLDQGFGPGGGASRLSMRPTIAHLTIASWVSGSRS